MVGVGVEVVDADGIDTKDLHQSSISQTSVGLAERVAVAVETRATARLICHADNLEFVAGLAVDEVVSLNRELWNSAYERCPEGREGHEGGLDLFSPR